MLSFLFLFGLALDVDQFVGVLTVETRMIEIVFGMMFPYLVEVVHVELSGCQLTCLTKEE